MTTPFSKYEILGRIVETVCHMPTDANQSEIRAYLTEYIYCKVGWLLGTIKYDPTLCIHKKMGENK